MKSKYYIFHDSWKDDKSGGSMQKVAKKLKHESEAVAALKDPKNYDAVLERHDSDGKVYIWDRNTGHWEEKSEHSNQIS